MKQKIDPYNLSIGIIYLLASWVIYHKGGIAMTLFLIFMALVFIVTSFFNKNTKRTGQAESKFILFCHLFVMLSMAFAFIASVYRKDITMAVFIFFMGIVFFILYLKEVKLIKNLK